MTIQKERETAIYILKEIFEDSAYNNIALRRGLDKNKHLNSIQRAFVTELVNGTLRNIIYLDYIINTFSKIITKKMKPFILYLLRISVYQIIFMEKIPHSAVCNEAVKLVKAKGFINLAGFVNGLLRNIIRNLDNIEFPNKEQEPIKYLSVIYSYPEWIIKYWLDEMDFATVCEICKNNNLSPKVTLCINTLKIDKHNLWNILKNEDIIVTEGNISKNSLLVTKISDILEKDSYKNGLYHIMDETSMLAVEIANINKGDVVFDVCAAPGGKSFYSSYIMSNVGKVLSCDIHEHKIKLINEGALRLGINIIQTKNKDSLIFDESLTGKADVLLIDAPCSGLGLIRKKPDIKYTKTYEEIISLSNMQKEILKNSCKYVKVGGTLIYSTCTISKKENVENLNWFLNNFNFELESLDNFIPDNLKNDTSAQGFIQILPNNQIYDGFFIARMIRKE